MMMIFYIHGKKKMEKNIYIYKQTIEPLVEKLLNLAQIRQRTV